MSLSATIAGWGHSVAPPTPESDCTLNKQTLTYVYQIEIFRWREEGKGREVDFVCIGTFLLSYIYPSYWYLLFLSSSTSDVNYCL